MHLISMKAILDAVTQFPQHKEYDRFTEKHRTKGKK
ncbi:hypothetical protein N037_20980 [Enterobacter sp. EGD-HP1]|nr:hypothetical protein N037_20980 [Enterobacter sp. EGD-HP1]